MGTEFTVGNSPNFKSAFAIRWYNNGEFYNRMNTFRLRSNNCIQNEFDMNKIEKEREACISETYFTPYR